MNTRINPVVLNLEEFIKTQIESVPELRALLFFQSRPQTDWDTVEVARKLYLQTPIAATVLTGLVAKGLLVSDGAPPRYRYQPQSAELAGLIEQLAEMDCVRPVTLINVITPLPGNSRPTPPLSSSQIEDGSQ